MNLVYDVLNRIESPNFFIGIRLCGFPNTPPPAKRIAAYVEEQLKGLDPDLIGQMLIGSETLDSLPHWPYEHDGWKIQFFPIAKSENLRGKPGVRPVGMRIPEQGWIDTSRQSLQSTLEEKAKKYGEHHHPYVIAVNMLTDFADDDVVLEALFGSDVTTLIPTGDGFVERPSRAPDGLWRAKSGPRWTRVSGVLVFFGAMPWSLQRTPVRLYINPWAEKPYAGELARFERYVVRDDPYVLESGIPLTTVLPVPGNPIWPATL